MPDLTDKPLSDVVWYHLDGTVCVGGWDPGTGLCWSGGGPVTPAPDVPLYIASAISSAVTSLRWEPTHG
jgi:hypothetical protein